jgi:3'(2'), 5'-bisphosphate nucleotidase
MGSAGVKAMAVLDGSADAYIHAGGQYQWDSAAPVAVALAAGHVATRLDGSPLRYNVPDLLLPDLIICHPARVDELRALLNGVGVGSEGSAAESAE